MPIDLQNLAQRRSDLVVRLLEMQVDLPDMTVVPDRSDPDYARTLLSADVAALEDALLAGLDDPEHRHSR